MRNLVHLSLEADPVTVADSLLDQQYPSSWGNGVELNGDLLALGLLWDGGPVVAGHHRWGESGLKQALERSWIRKNAASWGSCIVQWIAISHLTQWPQVWFSAFPNFIKEIGYCRVYGQRTAWRECTGQNLIVDQTHGAGTTKNAVSFGWMYQQL